MTKKKTVAQNKILSYWDLLKRSIEAGKQIEMSNKEESYNKQKKEALKKEEEMIKNLTSPTLDKKGDVIKEGMTQEKAIELVKRNYEITRKRELKKQKRKNKH